MILATGCISLLGLSVFALVRLRYESFAAFLLSLEGVSTAYLTLSLLFPLVLWTAGNVDPWPTVKDASSALVQTAVLALVWVLGLFVGTSRASRRKALPAASRCRRIKLHHYYLVFALAALPILMLLVRRDSLTTLDNSRGSDDLKGFGIAATLVFVPLVMTGAIVPIDRRSKVIRLGFFVLFISAAILAGSKAWLVGGLMGAGLFGARHRQKPRLIAAGGVGVVLLVMASWFQANVRRTALWELDERTPLAVVAGPVLDSGFDVVRTYEQAAEQAGLVSLRAGPLVGLPGSYVPAAILPGRPEPPSVQFSRSHFPDSFRNGSGTPPSLPAELVWYFGLAGGLLVWWLAAVATPLWDSALRRRLAGPRGPMWHLIRLSAAVALPVLIKSGFDSGLRLLLWACVAAVICDTILRLPPPLLMGKRPHPISAAQ